MKPTPPPPARKRTGPPNVHPTEEPVTKTFSILPSDLRTLTALGNGNRSAGLRAVLNRSNDLTPNKPMKTEPLPKIRCGEYINPQYGRTGRCSLDDWQCTECRLKETEQKLSLLTDAAKEAADHERAFWDSREQNDEYREPTWLAELEAAVKAVERE